MQAFQPGNIDHRSGNAFRPLASQASVQLFDPQLGIGTAAALVQDCASDIATPDAEWQIQENVCSPGLAVCEGTATTRDMHGWGPMNMSGRTPRQIGGQAVWD